MTKEEIEQELMMYLGVRKVIWLPRGLYGNFKCVLNKLSSIMVAYQLLSSGRFLNMRFQSSFCWLIIAFLKLSKSICRCHTAFPLVPMDM